MSVPYLLHSQILRSIYQQAYVTGNALYDTSQPATLLGSLLKDYIELARGFRAFRSEYGPDAPRVSRGYVRASEAYLQRAEDYILQRNLPKVQSVVYPNPEVSRLHDLATEVFQTVDASGEVFETNTPRINELLERLASIPPYVLLTDENLSIEAGEAIQHVGQESAQFRNAKRLGGASNISALVLYAFPAAVEILFSFIISTDTQGSTVFEPFKYLRPIIEVDRLEDLGGENLATASTELVTDQFAIQYSLSSFSRGFLERTFKPNFREFSSSNYVTLLKSLNDIGVLSVAIWLYALFAMQAKEVSGFQDQIAVFFKLRVVSIRKKRSASQIFEDIERRAAEVPIDLGEFEGFDAGFNFDDFVAFEEQHEFVPPPPVFHADDDEIIQISNPADFSVRKLSIPSNANGGYYIVNNNTTLDQIINDISQGLREVFHSNTGDSRVLFEEHEDRTVVTGIDMSIRTSGYPNAAVVPLSQARFGDQLRVLIQLTLARLKAFAVPEDMKTFFGKIGNTVPFLGSNEDCIVESFCYLLCWHQDENFAQLKQPEMKEKLKATMDTYTDSDRESIQSFDGHLLDTLEFLLKNETEMDSLYIGFFSGFSNGKKRPPAYPMLKLFIGEDDCLDYSLPLDGLYFTEGEVQGFEHMLIYFQGHVWPSTVHSFRMNINMTGTEERRLYQSIRDNPPESHVLSPIRLGEGVLKKQMDKNMARERFVPRLEENGKLGKFGGHFSAQFNQDNYSGDFETATCITCSDIFKVDKQECYASTIAWGTTENESITFLGQECPRLNAGKTFENATGCVTQTLRFIKKNIGAWQQYRPTMRPPSNVVNRRIYYFNGSKFDTWFILKTALYWNIPVKPVISNQKIMSLTLWENVQIVDFANIWSGFTLAGLFDHLSTSPVQVPNLVIPRAKWSCFPYLMIQESMIDPKRNFSLEELKERGASIWGGKCAKKPPKNCAFTNEEVVAINTYWWQENIGSYYCAEEHLGSYCCDDTLILQYMVITDHVLYARGTFNGRQYDHTNAITASQAAMLYFRQTCLNEPITAPDPRLSFEIFGEKYDMTSVLRFAYHGGKVELFRHTSEDPRYEEAHQRYYEETGDIVREDDYDVNSMYPSEMIEPMPVEFQSAEFWTDPRIYPNFIDTNIYLVSVEYPNNDCGIMTSYNGFNFSPSFIDSHYYDPFIKGIRLNMVFGVELNTALSRGAAIKVFGEMKFKAKVIFKTYIEELYSQRLATDNKVVKIFLKTKMNSTYGKVAQKAMAYSKVFPTLFDLEASEDYQTKILIDIEIIKVDRELDEVVIAYFMDPTHASIGQHLPIAAYITARGRNRINKYMYYVSKLKDSAGCPISVVYIDTDSSKHRIPGANQPFTQEWLDTYMHPTELGKFKSETGGIGFDIGYFIARKASVLHKFDPEDFKKPCEDPLEFLAKRKKICDDKVRENPSGSKAFGEEMILKHKGITHGYVDPMAMVQVATQAKSAPKMAFKLPPSFQRSMKFGIVRKDDLVRVMQVQNYTRTPPDANGATLPHASVEAFANYLNSLSE